MCTVYQKYNYPVMYLGSRFHKKNIGVIIPDGT